MCTKILPFIHFRQGQDFGDEYFAELDMIESWDAFRSVKPVETVESTTPISLEGGVTEAATEVEADIEGEPEEAKPLTGADLDWDNV